MIKKHQIYYFLILNLTNSQNYIFLLTIYGNTIRFQILITYMFGRKAVNKFK